MTSTTSGKGWNMSGTNAEMVEEALEKAWDNYWVTRIGGLIDVFEDCDDDADPQEIRELVFLALGLTESPSEAEPKTDVGERSRAIAIFEARMQFAFTEDYEQSREWSDAMAEATK